MARKLRPHEERAFIKAAPYIELKFRRDGCHASQHRADASGSAQPEPPEVPAELPNWDECSWPDEWGW